MSLPAKKLGILVSTSPAHPDFQRGVEVAATALEAGTKVYLYCIDEAAAGVANDLDRRSSMIPDDSGLFARRRFCSFVGQGEWTADGQRGGEIEGSGGDRKKVRPA